MYWLTDWMAKVNSIYRWVSNQSNKGNSGVKCTVSPETERFGKPSLKACEFEFYSDLCRFNSMLCTLFCSLFFWGTLVWSSVQRRKAKAASNSPCRPKPKGLANLPWKLASSSFTLIFGDLIQCFCTLFCSLFSQVLWLKGQRSFHNDKSQVLVQRITSSASFETCKTLVSAMKRCLGELDETTAKLCTILPPRTWMKRREKASNNNVLRHGWRQEKRQQERFGNRRHCEYSAFFFFWYFSWNRSSLFAATTAASEFVEQLY